MANKAGTCTAEEIKTIQNLKKGLGVTRKLISASFTLGLTMAMLVLCFWQDLWGLEGYIQLLRDHWIELPPWVFLPFMAFVIWQYLVLHKIAQNVIDMIPTAPSEETDDTAS